MLVDELSLVGVLFEVLLLVVVLVPVSTVVFEWLSVVTLDVVFETVGGVVFNSEPVFVSIVLPDSLSGSVDGGSGLVEIVSELLFVVIFSGSVDGDVKSRILPGEFSTEVPRFVVEGVEGTVTVLLLVS